jgi:hypothetical protein
MDALLAVEITPNKEYLLCFDGEYDAYIMLWYGMVWYGVVWYGMVWYGVIWYDIVWYGVV